MAKLTDEIREYKPIDLDDLEKKMGPIPGDMRGAIDMFNKALENIRGHNEDMAVIALKKAVSIYPAFYEAINLMGLTYLSMGDEEKARTSFARVIALDDSSIKASRYLDIMDGKIQDQGGDSKNRKSRPSRNKTVPAWIAKGLRPEQAGPWFLKYVMGFCLGVLLLGAVWLLIPGGKPLIQINNGPKESSVVDELKASNEELTRKLNGVLADLEKANVNESAMKEEMENYKIWTAKLYELNAMLSEGQFREIVVEIEKNMLGIKIPADIEQEITRINDAAKPLAVKQLYDSAKKTYDDNAKTREKSAYVSSAEEYALSMSIMEQMAEPPAYASEIYYYGGKAIALSGTPSTEEANQSAIAAFKKVSELSPGSKLASYAVARVAEIEAGKTIRH